MSKMSFTENQSKAIFEDGKNILVSAGAGSGKTAVLTERILEKLKKGVSLDNLVVLTFTNAAAFEMKARVKSKLLNEVKNNNSLLKEIDKIDSSLICTFDSFALFIVKKYSYLINLDSNISIADNIIMDIKKKEIIDNIFLEMYENKDENFYRLIDLFTVKDDKKIKDIIYKLSIKLESITNKEEYLNNYINDYYNENKINEFIKKYEDIIINKKNNIIDNLELLSYQMEDEKLEAWYNKVYENLSILKDKKTYDDIKDNFPIKLTPFTRLKDYDLEEIKKIYVNIKEDFTFLKENLDYKNKNEMLEEYLSTKNIVKIIIDILYKLNKYLMDFKEKNNIFEFSDIMRFAINILENNESIREEFKNNINEIMVDEYQDTNNINDYLIKLLASNNIYMVGDVKQSIYGFRDANPSIFMDKYENFSKHINGMKIDLAENFRSKKEVLYMVNEIFDKTMDLEIGGAEYTNGHQMIPSDKSVRKDNEINHDLEVLSYKKGDYKNNVTEAFIIGNDILSKIDSGDTIYDKNLDLNRKLEFKDFTIIMDRNSDFELYKQVFTYLKIPVILNKDDVFLDSDEIYVIKNILKLIYFIKEKKCLDTSFSHPFLSVCRSFVCNYKDEDIFDLVSLSKQKEKPIYNIFKESLIFSDLYNKLINIVKQLDSLTISELLYKVIIDFDFYRKINEIGDVYLYSNKLDLLISSVNNLESFNYNLSDLIVYLDSAHENNLDIRLSLKTDEANGVSMTNIHKSKGLEYPVCYYSGLFKTYSKEEFKDKFMFSTSLGFIVPIFHEGIKETFMKKLYKFDYLEKDKSEKLRLFYVALTRAREKMIFVLNLEDSEKEYEIVNNKVVKKQRENYNSFYDILESVKKVLLNYKKTINLEDINITNDYLVSSKNNMDLKFDNTDFNFIKKDINLEKLNTSGYSTPANLVSLEDKDKMLLGNKIHEYLELVDFNNKDEDYIKYNIDDFYQNKINKLLSLDFMNLDNSIYHKEYNFMYNDKEGIIDLLIETDDLLIIVDYKLKEINKEKYFNQIKGYKEYLNYISNKEVQGYLYSIIDEKYIKVV